MGPGSLGTTIAPAVIAIAAAPPGSMPYYAPAAPPPPPHASYQPPSPGPAGAARPPAPPAPPAPPPGLAASPVPASPIAPAAPGAPAAAPALDTALTRDYPVLGQLPRAEIEALLDESEDEDSLLEAYVLSLPQVQARLEQHDELLQAIETKARRNEAEQAPLEALRRDTERALAQAQAADLTWSRELEPALAEAYHQFTPGALHAKLVQGTTRIWDESEAVADAYVEGLPDGTSTTPPGTAQFLRKFQALRARYHRRALLAERWGQGSVAWPA